MDEVGSDRDHILLEYEPEKRIQWVQPPLQMQTESQVKKTHIERWNLEQIGDFVTKLGFLDKDGEGGGNIKDFVHLNQVNHAPCPSYFVFVLLIKCSFSFRIYANCSIFI